jgi:asparagine synthase (glutamine-hydrolysing)
MTSKHYLRNLYADLIPPELARRRKKGFSIPLKQWLKEELRPTVDDVLLGAHPRFEAVLDKRHVHGLIEKHRRDRADYAEVIWALLMLELWLRRFNVTPA